MCIRDSLKSVLQEVKKSEGQIILFIDELHTIVGCLLYTSRGEFAEGEIDALCKGDDEPDDERGQRRQHKQREIFFERLFHSGCGPFLSFFFCFCLLYTSRCV